MPYLWKTGWSGAVLLIFFVFSPVLALIVRRKWRIAESRRMEVMRLVRLAAAEAERAEKETAEVVYAVEKSVFGGDGGGIGMSNCAVCHNPTTNRCKRCKAVKYCSGTCQITHWRQGHKYECHPPVDVNHYNGESISSNFKRVDIESSEISGNGLGVEGKGHGPNYGFNIAQNVSNVVEAQSNPSILIDRSSDIKVKLNGTNSKKVSHLKGVQDERPENSGNGLEVEGKDHATSDPFHVDQSVSNVVETQSAASVLDLSRPDSEVRSNDGRHLERFSISMSSKVNISSKINSRNGDDGEKNFMSVSKKASIIDPLSSSFSTISAPVEMHDEASCNVDLERTATGQHSNANPHDREDEFFPRSDFDRCKTSVIDAALPNNPTIPDAPTTAGSLSHASISNEFQPLPINGETEFKLGAPSIVNSSSLYKSTDDRISRNAREFNAMGSSSINHDKSKTSNFSENYGEGKGGRIDLAAADTITCAGSTDSQSSHNIHLQLNSGLDFDLDVKLSSMKSSSAATNRVISDFRETVSVVIGNSGKVAAESNNGQLKPSSPDYLNDHRASVGHSKSLLKKESAKVENLPQVGDKSLKVDGSLHYGNVSLRKTVQVTTPSSSLSRGSQSELCNHAHGKYKYKTLFPYDNFIRLYNSDKVLMHPCGLVNCGNSCYANVVLQCLAFTRPLTAFILEGFHAKACPKKGWCFSCEFETLLIMVKRGKSPVTPNGIISHIHEIGSNFGHGREEDAHEFLRYSIDALQNACLKEVGAAIAGDLAEETTLIQLIFGGYLRSKIKCMRCRGKSERRERMMDLTIDVHGEVGTLEEALARFTASEVLEGDNKYKCERCKSFERAKKQLTILEAPNVLTIALKRYQSGKYGKLSRMVRFSEYLNLAPYMRVSDDNSPVYRLYAVVVHSGHANATFSGHYVCYVKNFQGKWFKADDSEVKEVNLQQVLSQGAYMLLYARCSPRAPRFLRKEMAKNMIKPKMNQDLLDERFRGPLKVDSSSDASSLFSCSDEGSSWSTESTKDSAASDDFADYSFGESSPRRVSVSSNGDGDGDREVGLQGREGLSFLYSVKQYRNLTEQFNGRKNSDWVSSEGKGNVLLRRNNGDRTARQFY